MSVSDFKVIKKLGLKGLDSHSLPFLLDLEFSRLTWLR